MLWIGTSYKLAPAGGWSAEYASAANKWIGGIGGGIVLFADGLQTVSAYQKGDNDQVEHFAAKGVVDATFVTIGIVGGPPGEIISGLYFLLSPIFWDQKPMGPIQYTPVPDVDNLRINQPYR